MPPKKEAALKKFISIPHLAAGAIVFILMVAISVFSLDVPFGEALLYSLILTVVGMVVVWWQYG